MLGSDTARIKATGKVISESRVHAFTIRNGEIAAMQEYLDTSAIVAELQAAQART